MTQVTPEQLTTLLQEWARTHPTTISDEHQQIRDAFCSRFPLETLSEVPLDEYVIGRGDDSNFCYWLEHKTGMLGSIRGGAAQKFGVYWSQKRQDYVVNSMFTDAEDARSRILNAVIQGAHSLQEGDIAGVDKATAEMGESRYSVRLKPLTLYFPDHLLPITSPEHLQRFLRLFGQDPTGDQAALNYQLLSFLRKVPGAESFDTLGLMRFLYDLEPSPPPVRQVWKVAVGEGSMFLGEALRSGAIFVGSHVPDLSILVTTQHDEHDKNQEFATSADQYQPQICL